MDSRRQAKVMKEFGKKLKETRLSKGIGLRELALLADIDPSSITRIESGKVNSGLTMIIALAEALGVEPAALVPSTLPD